MTTIQTRRELDRLPKGVIAIRGESLQVGDRIVNSGGALAPLTSVRRGAVGMVVRIEGLRRDLRVTEDQVCHVIR